MFCTTPFTWWWPCFYPELHVRYHISFLSCYYGCHSLLYQASIENTIMFPKLMLTPLHYWLIITHYHWVLGSMQASVYFCTASIDDGNDVFWTNVVSLGWQPLGSNFTLMSHKLVLVATHASLTTNLPLLVYLRIIPSHRSCVFCSLFHLHHLSSLFSSSICIPSNVSSCFSMMLFSIQWLDWVSLSSKSCSSFPPKSSSHPYSSSSETDQVIFYRWSYYYTKPWTCKHINP